MCESRKHFQLIFQKGITDKKYNIESDKGVIKK